jgi:hypothetical protein
MATPNLRSPHAERQAAAVVLARLAAQKEVRRRIKSLIPYARLTRLGNEWLEQHPALLTEALELATELFPQVPPVSRRKTKAG